MNPSEGGLILFRRFVEFQGDTLSMLSGATILQVIPDLAAGGAERTTIEIAEALHAVGAKALVASSGGRLEGELAAAGGELVRIAKAGSKNPLDVVTNSRRLHSLIHERKVDLVHARSRAPAWSALWAARAARRPFVTTYHGVYTARSGIKRFYNSVMARGDVVIANSHFTAEHVLAEHPEAADRIVAIPRGVDIAKFSPDAVSAERKAALAAAWRLPAAAPAPHNDPALILLAGRLTGWKGQREAIRAAALLAGRALPPWRLILAGDAQGRDAYATELDTLIVRHGLDDKVAIVGHCADMPAAFALADIVIAPSSQPEAFGRVAAEAGAMGRPVIGSDLGGQREVIRHEETGLLIPPASAPDLADAIADLLGRGPVGRAALGEAAIVRIRRNFTTSALQQATLAVYDRLIGRSS